MAASLTYHPLQLLMDSSDLDPHLIHGSLSPLESVPNGISISLAVFAYTVGNTPNAFQWAVQPQKLPIPFEDLDPM